MHDLCRLMCGLIWKEEKLDYLFMVLGPVQTSIHVIVIVAEEHFKGKIRQLVHHIPLLSPVAKFHLIITFACLCCY